jgi:uncharacterized repeat protein (TIGR03806 family)
MKARVLVALVFAAAAIGCSSKPDNPGGDGGSGGSGGGGGGGSSNSDGAAGGPADMSPWMYPGPSTTCVVPPRPATQTAVALSPALGGKTFSQPVAITQAPGDDKRFFVTQLSGQIRVVSADGTFAPNLIDLTAYPNEVKGGAGTGGQEYGLLGLTFSPNWQTNHTAYISYNKPSGAPSGVDSLIARYRSSDNGATLDFATRQPLIQFPQPYPNHKGGNILFGPDGYLYIGFGDGGSAGDPQNRAQDVTNMFGKMLRIDVENQTKYRIPPDNPFANDPGNASREIFAWGLRNPWRWSFDRATGELWVGDVGQDVWEEIDKVKLGGNYGWHVREAAHCYPPSTTTCQTAGLIEPIVEYSHTSRGGPGNCVIGGYVYRGSAIPSLVGQYVFADETSGDIWRIVYDAAGKAQMEVLLETGKNISSFGEGADGELYLTSFTDGKVFKLTPAKPEPPGSFPQVLSATGCVDANAPANVVPGLIPYDVNVPLWSDGAAKQRWLSLPPGGKIHVNADGDWDLPVGTVLVKEFAIGGKRVETRLLMRHTDGDWAGYSYEWNDAGTDATLLAASKSKTVNGQTWYYPSRAECLMCHTQAAGRSLGLETAQLNRDYTYPDGSQHNQVALLAQLGLFDGSLPPPPAMLDALPPPSSSAPAEARARAYLHANCSFCHRVGGTGRGVADFRWPLSFKATNVCNAAPQEGDLGVMGARLLVPGAPTKSIISLRMHALDVNRMPPLATHKVDDQGATLIDSWISSVTACP